MDGVQRMPGSVQEIESNFVNVEVAETNGRDSGRVALL